LRAIISGKKLIVGAKDKNAGIMFDPAVPVSHGDVNTDDLVKTAEAFPQPAKTAAIYLARMGVDRTSAIMYSAKPSLSCIS
jgi:hypothetical protein